MMMFNHGDIIRAKSSGQLGTIVKAGTDKTSGYAYYDVEWHHTSNKVHRYFEDEIGDEWEFHANSILSAGSNTIAGHQHMPSPKPKGVHVSGTIVTNGMNKGFGYVDTIAPLRASEEDLDKRLGPMSEMCTHSWKVYNSGFTEFEYCEYCDIKKEDIYKGR